MENKAGIENFAGVSKDLTHLPAVKEQNIGEAKMMQAPVVVLAERNKEEGKRPPPTPVKVPPKTLFGYPERYKSPTDAMVSPVSRGLLARNRRPICSLAPSVPPKALEDTFQETVDFTFPTTVQEEFTFPTIRHGSESRQSAV